MLAIVAAVALLALAVCLANLVLTVGVIRRLREHAELMPKVLAAAGPPVAAVDMVAPGEVVAPFEAVAVTGEVVSRESLSERTLFGAFTPDCGACAEMLPAFVELAAGFPGGRDRVVAVVVGTELEAAPYRERLGELAQVVVEEVAGLMEGRITNALQITAFPGFAVLDGSTVVVSGRRVEDLTAAAATAGT